MKHGIVNCSSHSLALYAKYAETIRQHKRIKAEVHTQ